MPTIPRSEEATAFLATVQDIPSNAVSACRGWTAHEVIAHLAAGAAEISRHLDPYLQGDPVPATQSFEARDTPFRVLDHDALLRRLDAEERKVSKLVDEVLTRW
ncbi:maleylpyruvate isomerase N-terminal domain-containing protein [Candidatus Mycobacterium methanotrophicum]|uniref:Maleylpyruvate isomerase N-terminal domain-containing protein n=1 Tax=Candidatus Mycobacterium methanotrophicum TaxID=2943498 RepID=A0ABY4QFW3_9MYCO|nr:maleylpyruvate isomerase N-terminal domain-containing protein [Candidatus Mycobacterium methanotrophicum]UQX09882.1 maleylpyruvate isomerase N-terminal domain-containing protein [Candidatus Mycobacterium methanotrophicum]